jgi:hypothetical protein
MLSVVEHIISLVYSFSFTHTDGLFLFTSNRMQIQKQQKKKVRERKNITKEKGPIWPHHVGPTQPRLSLLTHHSSSVRAITASSPPFSLPLSLAVLLFSLLGRLLPPPPSSPLPLRYIGRDWIGKGATGEFEPNQNPHLSRLVLSRFPPPALPPSADAASGL